jgi:hypothetical protein
MLTGNRVGVVIALGAVVALVGAVADFGMKTCGAVYAMPCPNRVTRERRSGARPNRPRIASNARASSAPGERAVREKPTTATRFVLCML